MPAAVERLADHVNSLKRGSINVSTATRLLSLARQVIEEDKSRSNYPTMALYADWSVHAKLNRKDAQKILGEIDEAFRVEAKQHGHFDANTMARAISTRKLGEEIASFLKAKKIDPTITEPQYLVPIIQSILEEVSTKPLELPQAEFDKKMKEQRSEDNRIEVVKSLVIEPNHDSGNKAKYQLRALVHPNPPVLGMPGFQLISAFPIASDQQGNVLS